MSSCVMGKHGESGTVVVRYVPIVIEGEEGGDGGEKAGDSPAHYSLPASGVVDDRSSLSSLASDNSVEAGGRREGGCGRRRRDGGLSPEYYSWDDWRERRKLSGVVADSELVWGAKGRGIRQVRKYRYIIFSIGSFENIRKLNVFKGHKGHNTIINFHAH